MKRVKRWITLTACALLFVGNVSAAISSEDDDEVSVVRPSGVHKRHAKSASRTRSRSSADSSKTDDISIPASALTPGPSGAVPNTRANSVVVVDARTGAVLHEKNADQPRPAASTQKLLTALIVAETGYLDRPVRVEPIDTFAEPVRLNIRPGDFYQRIDLLRALLVKSPNDVSRCRTRELENTNKVLKRLPFCNGMKTGYTEAAGHCLIASGSRPGRDIIVVVLGDTKSGVWTDAASLLSWGLWL